MDLNQVTLPVDDIDAACLFYRKLGFTQIVDTPHYARFECPEGNATFSLSLETPPIKNGAVIYFEHEQLDEWVTELEARVSYLSNCRQSSAICGEKPYCLTPQGTRSNCTGLVKIDWILLGVWNLKDFSKFIFVYLMLNFDLQILLNCVALMATVQLGKKSEWSR